MPKYQFTCPICSKRVHRYVSFTTESIKCECGNSMKRELPIISGQTEVREVIDPLLNKRHHKDQKEMLKERRREHFVNSEIPRLVDKYSIETCLENKWLIYNDKGELIINKDWVSSS